VQVLDLEKFATPSRRCTRVIDKLVGVQLVDYNANTYYIYNKDIQSVSIRRSSASRLNAQVYYRPTLVDCNPLNSITSICSGFVVQVVTTLLCSNCQDFD